MAQPAKAAAAAAAPTPEKQQDGVGLETVNSAKAPAAAAQAKAQASAKGTSPGLAPASLQGVRHVAVRASAPTPEDSVMYQVRDLLATNGARVHELVDRRGLKQRYTFKDDQQYVQIPMSQASRLIGNDGFEVLNNRGLQLRVVKGVTGQAKGVTLSHDEVVAKYDELTTDALVARATVLGFLPEDGQEVTRDVLIDFLIERSILEAEGTEVVGKKKADDEDAIDIEEENEF